MGFSKSTSKTKSTQTNAPSAYSQPYVDAAAAQLQPGFAAASANNATLLPRVNSALDYSGDVLSGKYLNGNPQLDAVIGASNRDITTGVDSRFEGAGRYGSGAHAGVLARALADNENRIRFGNYETERGYQEAAPGKIYGGVGASSGLPQAAGSTYADQVRALLGQYGTQTGSSTTKTSPNFAEMWLKAAAAAAQAAAAGG